MKKIIYFACILIISGCSANRHLQKALKKDPGIIDTKSDTAISVDISYKDTSIIVERKQHISIISDTAIIRDTIYEEKASFDPVYAHSVDGIAHAKASMKKGILQLRTWAKKDTIVKLKDTLNVKNMIIHKKEEIIKQNKAVITETKSFAEKLQNWIFIVILIAGLIIFVLLISLFRKS